MTGTRRRASAKESRRQIAADGQTLRLNLLVEVLDRSGVGGLRGRMDSRKLRYLGACCLAKEADLRESDDVGFVCNVQE